MKTKVVIISILVTIISFVSCTKKEKKSELSIIFLHHSTGEILWNGSAPSGITKVAGKISNKLADFIRSEPRLPILFEKYNEENNKNYSIDELTFPKESPYGWHNFPYDYYNIWVKHAGEEPYLEEPTLEILTKDNQVVIFKHCFPVSNIQAEIDSVNINSDLKTISNYKLQYISLRDKLHQFPHTKFIVFTGAAQVKANISEDKAIRAWEFFKWIIEEWDKPNDNIFIWDLYNLQTEGEIYFKEEYATSPKNSHPNSAFAEKAVELLFIRIIDIIENDGTMTQLTGLRK